MSKKQREKRNEKTAQKAAHYWRLIEENKWGGSYGVRKGEASDEDEDEEADERPAPRRRGRPTASRAQDTNDIREPSKKRAFYSNSRK